PGDTKEREHRRIHERTSITSRWPDLCAAAMLHRHLPGHIVDNPSEGSSRGRSDWTPDAQLYVSPSCSRRGVGSALLTFAETSIRDSGHARMARRRMLASASASAASPTRICIKSLDCLHDRVAKAVPRRLAQVWMDQPSTKHALTLHAHSFEETRRRHVVHIAGRPHPIDRRSRQGPLDHGRHRFTHEALTPPAPRKRITQIHCTCSHADFDQSHERAILLGPETPRKSRSLGPDAF